MITFFREILKGFIKFIPEWIIIQQPFGSLDT